MTPVELARTVTEKSAQFMCDTGRRPKRVYISSEIVQSLSDQLRWTRDARDADAKESMIAGLMIVEVLPPNHIEIA